jgi:AcrR family transcriptional regulator
MSRLPRNESRQRTREALLSAARAVFLERGFHAASIAEIADAAGFSTGAVYSNFSGKDDLLVAVLDAQLAESAEAQEHAALAADDFESSVRAVARELHAAGVREPMLTPLRIEFWTPASRDAALRKRLLVQHEHQIDGIAALISEVARRQGRRFRVPPREVARAGGAVSRGFRLERLLDADGIAAEVFEDVFFSLMDALTEPEE